MIRLPNYKERCTLEVASLHNFFFFFTLNFYNQKAKQNS